jgi:chromosome segregation ATPase
MNDLYEENYKKIQNQVNELKLELTQKEVNLTEQTHLKDSFETKYNEANKQIEELFNISKSKDNLISTQNDAIKMYEEQIGQYKRTKEDYELSLNKYIVNFKMKEDEIEYIMGAIEGIITKKKDKFEYNAKRLSVETNSQIYNIIKNYNFKFK